MPGIQPRKIEPQSNQCTDCRRLLKSIPYRGMSTANDPARRNKTVECVVCPACDWIEVWPRNEGHDAETG